MLKIYASYSKGIAYRNIFMQNKLPFLIEKIKIFDQKIIMQGRNYLCVNNNIFKFPDLIGDFTVRKNIIYCILHNGKIFKLQDSKIEFMQELKNKSTSFYHIEYKDELLVYRNLYNRLYLNETDLELEYQPGRMLAFSVNANYFLCTYESRAVILSDRKRTLIKIADRRRQYLKCGFFTEDIFYAIDDLHNLLICTISTNNREYINLQCGVDTVFANQIFLKNGGIAAIEYKNYAKPIEKFDWKFTENNFQCGNFCIKNKRNLFFNEKFVKNYKNRIKNCFLKNNKLYILTENRLYIYKKNKLYTKYEFYKPIDGIFFEQKELFFYRFNHQSVEIFSTFNAYFFIHLNFQPKIYRFENKKLQCKIKNNYFEIFLSNFSYFNIENNFSIRNIRQGKIEGPILNIFQKNNLKIILREGTKNQVFIAQKGKIKNIYSLNGKILFARKIGNEIFIFCEKKFLYRFFIGRRNLFFRSKTRLSHRISDIQFFKSRYIVILANGTISNITILSKVYYFTEFTRMTFCPVLFYKNIIFGSNGTVMWKNKIIYAHKKIIIAYCIAKNNLYTVSDDHTISLISKGRLVKHIVGHHSQPISIKYYRSVEQIVVLWNSKKITFFDLNLNFMRTENIFMREPKNILISKKHIFVCGDQLCKLN